MTEHDLEDVFGAARLERPIPSGNLIARIGADAEAEHKRRSSALASADRPSLRWSWPAWLRTFRGTGTAAGLFSATLVGLWLGFAQPVPVAALAQSLENAIGVVNETDQVELIPSLDLFSLEG